VAETQKEGALLAIDTINKRGGLNMPGGKVLVEGEVADDEDDHDPMDMDEDDYDEDYDDDDYDDEDYDDEDCDHNMSTPGFILLDSGGGFDIRSDEQDYRKMIKEDKHEKCTSDDEQTFMKESYKPVTRIETPETSPKNKLKISSNNNKTKNDI
jgi:formylmethanofuran dehydrogenase subunit C